MSIIPQNLFFDFYRSISIISCFCLSFVLYSGVYVQFYLLKLALELFSNGVPFDCKN